MRDHWGRDRLRYGQRRHVRLRALNINRVWPSAWYPSTAWSQLPALPLELLAALAEKTGDLLGVDVPGVTMAQMTIQESHSKPGSAGVDAGGTRGYGPWAITTRFNDALLARFGWSYEPDMWNPVRNAVAMVHIYATQGTGAWYGNSGVTCWGCHYTGKLDLRLYLNGMTLREVLRTS